MKILNSAFIKFARLIRFVLVGGSSTALAIGLTWLFVEVFHLHVTLGSTFALTLCALYNYSMHYYWTFNSNAPHGLVLIKYLLMCMGALMVNALVMHIGVLLLPLHYLLVQLVACGAVTLWSICLSALWVFPARQGG